MRRRRSSSSCSCIGSRRRRRQAAPRLGCSPHWARSWARRWGTTSRSSSSCPPAHSSVPPPTPRPLAPGVAVCRLRAWRSGPTPSWSPAPDNVRGEPERRLPRPTTSRTSLRTPPRSCLGRPSNSSLGSGPATGRGSPPSSRSLRRHPPRDRRVGRARRRSRRSRCGTASTTTPPRSAPRATLAGCGSAEVAGWRSTRTTRSSPTASPARTRRSAAWSVARMRAPLRRCW
mmetsp:Transcript_90332/g.258466  ORF Transcript_90332/g.258466 Transcript_90332/m.258466 type:complete len:230 (-) Transcript_90332:678-1367(-)